MSRSSAARPGPAGVRRQRGRAPRRSSRAPRAARARRGGRRRESPPSATSRAASCCRANASRACSTRAAVPRACRRSPPHDLYDGAAPGAGIIAGIGRVDGREFVIAANDATVKGGAYFPMTVKKHLRAQEVALHNRLPCIYLVDSGGAFLPMQDEIFPDREHFGRIFFNQANHVGGRHRADRGRHGLLHRGRRVRPGDERRDGHRARPGHDLPGGPPLVKAATGEEVTAEELGGGDLHARRSGVADHLADDDAHALQIVRSIVATLRPAPRALGVAPCRGAGRRPGAALRRRAADAAPPTTRARSSLASSTARAGTSSRRCTRRRSSAASPTSTAIRSASLPTRACCSPTAPARPRTSSRSATSAACRCCSCRTSAASWSAGRRGRRDRRDGAKMVAAVSTRGCRS